MSISVIAASFDNGDEYFERDAVTISFLISVWLVVLVIPACLTRCCARNRFIRNCCCCCMGTANRSFVMSLILWLAWLIVASLCLGLYERPAEVAANAQKRELITKWAEIGEALKRSSLTPEQISLINAAAVTDADLTYNWIFEGCAFFISTLGSTVGYGSFAPMTDEGRLISCLLLVPSIVLFLKFSTHAGERLTFLYGVTVADSTECCMKMHYGKLYHVVGLLKAKEKEGEAWSSSAVVKKLRKMDKNRDGTLSEQEFRDGLKKMRMNIPENEMAEICEAADVDGDGTIDFMEGADAIVALLSRLEAAADRSRARANIIQICLLLLVLFVCNAGWEHQNTDLKGTHHYWDFWNALYFDFITATTVGLGDMVPIVPPFPLPTASESEISQYVALRWRLEYTLWFKIPIYICLMSAILQSFAVLWNTEAKEEEENQADGANKLDRKDRMQLNVVKPVDQGDSLFTDSDSDSLFSSSDSD